MNQRERAVGKMMRKRRHAAAPKKTTNMAGLNHRGGAEASILYGLPQNVMTGNGKTHHLPFMINWI
jgi:hypothetical protein